MEAAAPSIDLDKLKQQDHTHFERVVALYHRQLVAVARAIIGDSLAEEVVQEGWVSAYRALPKFEGRSSLKTCYTPSLATKPAAGCGAKSASHPWKI